MGIYCIKKECAYLQIPTLGSKYFMSDMIVSVGLYALVGRKFYWHGLHKVIQDYVLDCRKCKVNKVKSV